MKKCIYLLFIFSLFKSFFSFAQITAKADSLLKAVYQAPPDTLNVKNCNTMAWEIKYNNPDTSLLLSKSALEISEKLNWDKGKAQSYHFLGLFNYLKGNYPLALQFYNKTLYSIEKIQKKNKKADSEIIALKAKTMGYMGLVFSLQGNLKKSLVFYLDALRLDEQLKNTSGIARHLGNIGIVYFELKNYSKALEYYFKALDLSEKTDYIQLQANTLGNIGLAYFDSNDKTNALDYFNRALELADKNGFKELQANTLENIGKIYESQNENQKALERYLIALKIKEVFGSKRDIGVALNYIGSLYLKIKKYPEAETWLLKARACVDSAGTVSLKKETYNYLAGLYAQTGRWKEAYNCFYIYLTHHDTLIIQQNQREMANKELEFEYAKKAAQDSVKNAEEKKTIAAQVLARDEQLKRAALQRYALFGGLSLLIVFGIFMFRRFKITQKQKQIIEKQKLVVEEQRDLVNEKNKEILDSIAYAKRLQEAILPPQKLIQQFFPDSFIYYKPKDIVAGDFYWFEQKNDLIFIAAGDCTGHGVPGAMVSVVCSSALSRVVKEFGISVPGKILDRTRELVLETFEKSEKDVKDGMDISLMCIHIKTGELFWSGAYNRLWYSKMGHIIEIAADKQPIGKTENPLPFTTHHIALVKGDCFYLFTDGFADQFGGPGGKKLKYKLFKETIAENTLLSLATQQLKLEEAFDNWKGSLEQVDDICIIGIRI